MKKAILFYVIFMLTFSLTVTLHAAPLPANKAKCGWKMHKKEVKRYKNKRNHVVHVTLK